MTARFISSVKCIILVVTVIVVRNLFVHMFAIARNYETSYSEFTLIKFQNSTKTKSPDANSTIYRYSTAIENHTKYPSIEGISNKIPSTFSTQNIVTSGEMKHIAFLKVHKAASSTVQNIFLRFGYSRNLTFVIPRVPKFFYPNVISNGDIDVIDNNTIFSAPENKSYDILCCHVIYNKTVFDKVMPPDTKYIGIVRDPFQQFISTLNYFKPFDVFRIPGTNKVSKFLRSPLTRVKTFKKSYVNNRMSLEFGFPDDLIRSRNTTLFVDYLDKLDKEFYLVLVVERFDESLVLMRRMLNWQTKDIIYIKSNVQRQRNKEVKFSGGDVELYKRLAKFDYALYTYFYKRLMDRIFKERPDFYDEVLYFKTVRLDIEYFCLHTPDKGSRSSYPNQTGANPLYFRNLIVTQC